MDDVNPTQGAPSEPGTPRAQAPPNRRKLLLGGLTLLFVSCSIGYGIYWALLGRFSQSTDDAYVGGNIITLTPRIDGTVVAIRADDTQRVNEGQAVVLLDSTDARIALDQAEARLAQTVRQVQGLYQAAAQQAANVRLQRARLAQSRQDYRRDQDLAARNFVSTEDFQHRATQVDVDRASLDLVKHQLATTEVSVANTQLTSHPQFQLAASALRDAYLAVHRTRIRAPVTGYVDKRSVQIGQRVSPGTPLLAIIPLDQIWVDANFKESNLRDIRIGQPVKLTCDLYGDDVVYHGHVLGLGAGTGSAFAVLPPQNATGNWIKVVQRVPVRIGLEPREIAAHPLRIGLSMEAEVDTHDRSGATLSRDPKVRELYSTNVYKDEDKGADALIARIVKDNTVSALRADAVVPQNKAPGSSAQTAANRSASGNTGMQ